MFPLPPLLKKFNSIKIFHIGDYFAYHSATEVHSRLEIGATALFGYCMHDKYCNFFREYYSSYVDIHGVPFDIQKDLKNTKNSVQTDGQFLWEVYTNYQIVNLKKYIFRGNLFLKHEQWFHRFREKLFSKREELRKYIEELRSIFNNNQRLDLVKAFNDFKFFVSCESIFNFPTAKVYEGTASGSILLASEHPVYDEIGFKNNQELHFI